MPSPIRPTIARMPGYVPGEQPRGKTVKLNTNENPYPPSPEAIRALRAALDGGGECARRYPDPQCTELRQALAEFDGVSPDQIVVGNGSDEILRLLMTATLDPGSEVGTLWPTYSYFEFLAAQCDARPVRHGVGTDGHWPDSLFEGGERLLLICNPNPPVGTLQSHGTISKLCEARPESLVVIDEAYIGFAPRGASAVSLLGDHPNLMVVRTFSKSHQLAGLRAGYAIGTGEMLAALLKIKDSYNVNALTQAAATASIRDTAHFESTRAKIIAERERLAGEMRRRGFEVPESHGNFLFTIHARAQEIFEALVERRVFVRWWDKPGMRDGFRITVGLPEQTEALLRALDEVTAQLGR
jgi:histidinol-phosphate aminotransferase